MLINEPDYLKAGDVVMCPSCGIDQWLVQRDTIPGERIRITDFGPVRGGAHPRKGAPMVCSKCKEQLTITSKVPNGLRVRQVARHEEPTNPGGANRDGVDPA